MKRKSKPKYDDADINQAIWLLQQNGFDVNRTWFNREHRIHGPVSAKEVKKACEWLKDNPSGCVHYDMFRHDGMTYSIVFGVWGDEDDYGRTYLGRVRNIARAALTKSTDDACGGDNGKGDDNGEQD